MAYDHLFSPLSMGSGVTLRNRIVLPPMNNNFADAEGFVTPRLVNYYVERGRGGAALLIVSPGYIDPAARKRSGSTLLHDDRYIPSLKNLTDLVHKTGALIFQQINHNGRLLTSSRDLKTAFSGRPVGPSAVPHLITGEVSRALTVEEIQDLAEKFGQSALRAKKAGFDGVELHGAHGYLLNQFFSRHSNHRTDEYGGSIERRMRFPLEVVRRVRELAGPDFLICYRISAVEYTSDGVVLEESVEFARRLEAEKVDMIHVSAGNSETPLTVLKMIPPSAAPPGCYAHLSRAVKQEVKIPVILVGRINSPEIAEAILSRGDADLVATGRALIADPHWPAKALSGRRNEIRQCIGCSQGCYEYLARERPITCLYNPEAGRESDPVTPAPVKKRIWVAGGGPGGMEAARVAALRGHNVTLFEKGNRLGGQVLLAAVPPGKEEFEGVAGFLSAEIYRLGVDVRLGQELSPEMVAGGAPEVLILATGSTPLIPDLPGVGQANVVTAREVLAGCRTGNRVAVIGGGLVGIETALFLTGQGKDVTVVEMLEEIGADAGPLNRERLKEEIKKNLVQVFVKTSFMGIQENKVKVRPEDGEKEITVDTLVLAIGSVSQNSLYRALQDKKELYRGELYQVGDCVAPRNVLEAVHDGHQLGRTI